MMFVSLLCLCCPCHHVFKSSPRHLDSFQVFPRLVRLLVLQSSLLTLTALCVTKGSPPESERAVLCYSDCPLCATACASHSTVLSLLTSPLSPLILALCRTLPLHRAHSGNIGRTVMPGPCLNFYFLGPNAHFLSGPTLFSLYKADPVSTTIFIRHFCIVLF